MRPARRRVGVGTRWRRAGGAPLLPLLLGLLAACAPADEPDAGPAMQFDTAQARIETATDTFELDVELAVTPEQKAHGLMERTELPEDHGMLFVYDEAQDPGAAFYMFRTRIPLDIAFLDEDGRIVSIRSMEPCPSPNPSVCPRYPAGEPFHAALEVNRGYFSERGIDVGDRVVTLPPRS